VCGDAVHMRVFVCLIFSWVGCLLLVVHDLPLVGSVSHGG